MIYQYLDSVDSTNNELKRRLAGCEKPEEFTVISAGVQTAGRGRSGHEWTSLPGVSISTSMVVYPKRVRVERLPQLTIVAAMAVAGAVEGLYELETQIKWPNDVLIDRKKICGILTERIGDAVIIGIGVNVYRGSCPEELAGRATTLAEELAGCSADLAEELAGRPAVPAEEPGWRDKEAHSGAREAEIGQGSGGEPATDTAGMRHPPGAARLSRKRLTREIWERFYALYRQFLVAEDLFFLSEAYNARLINAGEAVRIIHPEGSCEAIAERMDNAGRLVVIYPETGETGLVDSGEVHIRGVDGYV